MNGKDIFLGLSDIDRKYIMEAETEMISRGRPMKRTVLLAAAIAMLMILAGCVAVFLGLQDRQIGQLEGHRNFDAYGMPQETPPEELMLVTMSGLEGSPAWQASKEWFEFSGTYVPEDLTNEPDHPDIPNNYEYTYHCWDQTMVDKLDEIARKYDMKLLGERAVAQRWQREAAFKALGIPGLIREGAKADYSYGTCQTFQPHNFRADVTMTLTGEDADWDEEVYATLYYLQTGYLSHDDVFTYDPNGDQWQYRTADGSQVLLALSGTNGLILCQREDAAIAVHVSLYWQGIFLEEGTALPTRKTMEAVADCFDFTIATRELEDGLQEKLEAIPNPDAKAAPPMERESYHTYAEYINRYLYPEFMAYVLHDLDKDGQQELLISTDNETFAGASTIRDGEVVPFEGLNMEGISLLENDLILVKGETILNSYWFVKSMTPAADGVKTANVCGVLHEDGVWTLNGQETTEEKALAAIGQYKPLKVNWQPLTAFPMDDGRTFGQVLAEEYHPEGQELLRFYAEHGPKDGRWRSEFRFYALQDMNADGVEDLLVSMDGDYIEVVYTVKRGRLEVCGGDFYLCQDGIEMRVDDWEDFTAGRCRRYQFGRQEADWFVFWETYLQNQQTGVWYDELSRELPAGTDPLAMYPRAQLQMQPIQDLLDLR